MNMDFGARGTFFRDIFSGVNIKWYEKSSKESDEVKNIDQNYYCSNYYGASLILDIG